MVCKNLDGDFNFICYTENSNNINSNIIIRSLPDYDLEKWWWKLTLFKYPAENMTLFLDLDIVIQKNITHLKKYCVENKLRLIKSYWKPYRVARKSFDTKLNSSIMIWKGDCTSIWNKFYKDEDYYMLKYNGIDGYLDYNQRKKLLYFPDDKIVYSRLYGTDKNNYWKASKDLAPNYFYAPDYDICIFNGWRRKTKWKTNEYALDDEGYDGFEHYWN
jgi:hypothetical protein